MSQDGDERAIAIGYAGAVEESEDEEGRFERGRSSMSEKVGFAVYQGVCQLMDHLERDQHAHLCVQLYSFHLSIFLDPNQFSSLSDS